MSEAFDFGCFGFVSFIIWTCLRASGNGYGRLGKDRAWQISIQDGR